MTASGGAPDKKGNEVQHLVTQDTRFQIIQNILAHPESLPSLRELEYVVDKGRSTIHGHLETLEEVGIVERFKRDDAGRDQPSTFYGLTPYGLRIIDELDLFNDLQLLRQMYTAMDKPSEVIDYEEAPRPAKATQEELEAELAEHLETLETSDGQVDNATKRRIKGLSYTLDEQSGAKFGETVAQELGQRVLTVLAESTVASGVLDGLRQIAESAPDVIAPAVPRLIELLDETTGDCRTKALQVLAAIAKSEEVAFDSDIKNQLGNLDISSLIGELPLEEAQAVVDGLNTIYAEMDATESRAKALVALGEYGVLEEMREFDPEEEAYETVTDAFETAAVLYDEINESVEEANALHSLGLCRYFASDNPVTEPLSTAAELYQDAGEFESAARVYSHLVIFEAETNNIESAVETIDHIDPLKGSIDDESVRAIVAAAEALVNAHQDEIDIAISLVEEVSIEEGDWLDKSIFGSVQLILAKFVLDEGEYDAAKDLAASARDIAEERGSKQVVSQSEETLARISITQGHWEDVPERLTAAAAQYEKIDHIEDAADCLNRAASIENVLDEHEAAIDHATQALELLNEESPDMKVTLNQTLADIHAARGDRDALETTLNEVEATLDLMNTPSESTQARVQSHRGELCLQEGDTKKAISHLQSAVDHYASAGDIPSQASTALKLAETLKEVSRTGDAIERLEDVIELTRETDEEMFQAIALLMKVTFHREDGSLEAALESTEAVLELEESPLINPVLARGRYLMGTIQAEMDQYDVARETLTDALSKGRQLDADQLVVDVLKSLVEIALETDESKQVISWCESAESYIESSDENFAPETKLYFIEKRAKRQIPENSVEDLLYVGLRYLDMDQVDDSLQPLRDAWETHTELDSETDAYTAALSAGVGFVGATQLVTLDEAQAVGREVLEQLEELTDSLTDPARYCYQFFAESTDTYSSLKLEAADRLDNGDSRLAQLEAVVFRDLVEQLRSTDDDFNTDPTEPLETALESSRTTSGRAIQQSPVQSAVSEASGLSRRSA